MDTHLSDIFEQLVTLTNHSDMLSILAKQPSQVEPDDYVRINSHLNRIYSFYSPIIDSILVNLHNGSFVLAKSEGSIKQKEFPYNEYWQRLGGNQHDFYWRTLHNDTIFSNPWDQNKVISFYKMTGKENSDKNSIILFHLRQDFFRKILDHPVMGENGYLMLVNPEGMISFKDVREEYRPNDEVISHLQDLEQEQGKFEFWKPHGKKMIVIYDTLRINKWKVAAVFPEEQVFQNSNNFKFTILFVVSVLIIIALFLANILARHATKPITLLVENLKTVPKTLSKTELEQMLQQKAPSEINMLYHGFADLSGQVNQLLEQIQYEQETKRQLELAIMQAQINPHFLYNTLYSIKGLCDMGLNEDASAMVTALSHFFRIGISRGKEIITIREEIEHIENYLFIQEMRYGDDFSYEVEVDPEIITCQIIKLTLQPIIENAIYHGVKQKRGRGLLQVRGYREENQIRFIIQDNGNGISPERLASIRQDFANRQNGTGTVIGFGMRSVHERIQLHYGTEYGLQIESESEQGTTVTIVIPIT